MSDRFLGKLRIAVLVSLAAWLALASTPLWLEREVVLRDISKTERNTFFARLPDDAWSSHRHASAARVYEDGRSLAWGNAMHDAIRSQGRGRYSFWHAGVYFSASDNSDPTINGRRYVARGPRPVSQALGTAVEGLCVSSVLLLAVSFVAARRRATPAVARDCMRFLVGRKAMEVLSRESRLEKVLVGGTAAAAGALALLFIAAWLGLVAPIRLVDGGSKDARLVASILFHCLLGVILAMSQLVVGAGLCLAAMRRRSVGADALVLFGYPLALGWAAACAAAAITWPGLRAASVVAFLCGAAPLLLWRVDRPGLAALGRAAVLSLPFAVAFGILLGALWHGPTSTLAASVMGDHVFYSANTAAYALGLWPIAHLGVAGETQSYFAAMPSLVGASLRQVGGFEPFLFFATSVPLLCTLQTVLGLVALRGPAGGAPARPPGSLLQACGCGLLIAGASQFPSWLVSSPPVALVPPLALSVYALSRGARFRTRLAALVTAVAGTLLTKLTAGAALLVLCASGLAVDLRWSAKRWQAALVVALGLATAAAAVAILLVYAPSFATIASFGPRSWHYGRVSPGWLARDAGMLVLGLGALAWAPRPAGLAIVCGIASSWLSPFLLEAAGLGAVAVAAGVLASGAAGRWLVRCGVAAGALLCAGTVGLEPAGRVPASALLALLAVPCVVGLRSSPRPQHGLAWSALPWSVTALSIGAALSLASGALILNSGHRPEELTPDARDIWRAAKAKTPPRALIFTDQTGSDTGLLGGWNTYCITAQRQVFVASVLQSRLRFDAEAQRVRLLQNEGVLRGTIDPAELPEASEREGWYAVVSNARVVPPSFRSCHRNELYSLYAIPAQTSGTGGACRE